MCVCVCIFETLCERVHLSRYRHLCLRLSIINEFSLSLSLSLSNTHTHTRIHTRNIHFLFTRVNFFSSKYIIFILICVRACVLCISLNTRVNKFTFLRYFIVNETTHTNIHIYVCVLVYVYVNAVCFLYYYVCTRGNNVLCNSIIYMWVEWMCVNIYIYIYIY